MPAPGYSFPAHVTAAAALVFIAFAWVLTQLGFGMFTDTDPLWHIAAGDLIRATGEIPKTDPWSFTAGNYPWLNIAWGWDMAFSALRELGGWHAAAAANAVIIAGTVALIFTHCALRSGSTYIALLTSFGALSMLVLSLRPLQVSHFMAALWFLLLGQLMRSPATRLHWLAAFPPLMLVWVNCHGGFIMGFVLLAAYTAQALIQRNRTLAKLIAATFVACALAALINPHGANIIEATRRPLATVANVIIKEWQPFSWTDTNIVLRVFLLAYLLLLPVRRIPMLPAERALALLWCALSFTANRYMTIFAILAAPQVAAAIGVLARRYVKPRETSCRYQHFLGQRGFAKTCLIMAAASALWLVSPLATRISGDITPPLPTLSEEITFLKTRAPAARILTHFNIASIISFETRGEIKVFVDPRTETAFPPQVLADYVAFHQGSEGWESIFKKYGMTAAILPNPSGDAENDAIYHRMLALPGWKLAFKGSKASVFLPSKH